MTTEHHQPAKPFEPLLWRHFRTDLPEIDLAFSSTKNRFWKRTKRMLELTERQHCGSQQYPIVEQIWAKASHNPIVAKPLREGDSNLDYPIELVSQMQHTTPQFNLRNVKRVTRNIDVGEMELTAVDLPERKGFEEDLVEVRNARHDAPEFLEEHYSTVAVTQLQQQTRAIFVENDWEQWYGEDKKRAMGALWRWIPPNGGRRTRPFPKDMIVTPHKFWKGRLITEEY